MTLGSNGGRASTPTRTARPVLLVATLLVLASVAGPALGANWPGFQNNSLNEGTASGKELPSSLKPLWTTQADGKVKASPIVGNGILFIATEKGNVYGYDVRDGKPLWGPVKLKYGVTGTPAFENSRLYVATMSTDGAAGELVVLDSKTGANLTVKDLGSGSYGGPTVFDGKLYVGTDAGNVMTYDTESMTKLWEFSTALKVDKTVTPEDGYGREDCCIDTDLKAKPVKTSPAVYDDRVYFGAFNHILYAIDSGGKPGTDTTTVEWVENLHDIIYSSPSVARYGYNGNMEGLLVGSYDGYLYMFNPDPLNQPVSCPQSPRTYHPMGVDCSKRFFWGYDTGSRIFATPTPAREKAYIGDEAGTLHAVWLQGGRAAWAYDLGATIRSSAVVNNNTIVVGTYDGKLFLFKEDAEGNLMGDPFVFSASDKIHASPAVVDGKVYLASEDGIIYALTDPTEAPETTPEPTKPGSLPDLALKGLRLTPEQPTAEAPLEVQVTVGNVGDAVASAFKLSLYDGGRLIGEVQMDLAAGETKSHTFPMTPLEGELALRAVVNEGDTIEELTSANNEMTKAATATTGGATDGGTGTPTDGATDDAGGGKEEEPVPAPGIALALAVIGLAAVLMRRRLA